MTTENKSGGFLEQVGLCLSVLFYVLFAWHQWWSGVSPRLIRGSAERDAIHHAHLSIGATLFVILVLMLAMWLFRPGASILERLKGAFSTVTHTAISLFFIFMTFAMLCGLAQAWAKGEETPFLGVFKLPHFLDWSWNTAGYNHSAFSNIASALFLGIVFVYLFTHLRRYVKPGVAVAILLIVHLLVNLPKPPSLHPIAAFGTYVLIPSYYLIALALYSWAKHRRLVYWPVFAVFIGFFMYLPYFAFKVLPPWHQKAAAETVLVESTETLVAARPQAEIFATPEALASAKDEATWCTQCHNATESDTHLLGPNLVGVFNRQAGTVEGYGRYSEAMIKKGLEGVFWTRANLSEFLLHGQEFIPGNLMNQQSDLSDPEKRNQVIDYLEYISSK
ncbi:c-type cytochrome [Paraglaciecola sp. 2405UD69-4]|uniref:c-type cytochrome n=1 Tax=Paraglaciecola sp. 2405UD69-4 TaxID=3391836 RepID=UPI0039C90785